ncbi:unnamed protein product [Rotaria magnacalcarata]|nr:unnamed protein product [Rotaria magnacalcarata]
MSLSTADHYYQTLERDHKKEIEGLKFKSNQLVKQFKAQGFSMLGQLPEESETILELKDIIGGFKEKIDKHLTDNNIHNKIKSDVFKLFRSKFDQQIDQLKQIEKNVKQTEERLIYANNLEGFKATQGNLRHYQKQIDKWKLDSDDLIETITMKALELSCKTEPNLNKQNNLQVQKLMDEMIELKNMVKMNQNPIELPPIEQSHHDEYGSFEVLNHSVKSKSEMSSFVDILEASEKSVKDKTNDPKTEKRKGEIKGELKIIKMGIIKEWPENDILENLKYTKNYLSEIKEHFINHNDDLIAKGNESMLIETLGDNYFSDSEY